MVFRLALMPLEASAASFSRRWPTSATLAWRSASLMPSFSSASTVADTSSMRCRKLTLKPAGSSSLRVMAQKPSVR